MEEKKIREISNVALSTLIADAALEVVRIAQDWELEAGMSYENPVLEVAAAMLRQHRAIKQQYYQNTHADAPTDKPGRFALPPVLRKFFGDELEGAE